MTHLILQQRNAGFFSDFNLIAACLKYFYDNKIEDFNVYWTNSLYQTKTSNMFDEFFFPNKKIHQFSNNFDVIHQADYFAGIFEQFTKHHVFVELHEVLKHYNYFYNPLYLQCKEKAANKPNSLGVHIRRTDHNIHYPFLNLDVYLTEINRRLNQNSCADVFVCTDEANIVDILKREFGEKVYVNSNVRRSLNNTSIHTGNNNFPDKHLLALEVMTDALSLSMCEEILNTSSNVVGYTLMVNPNIKYTNLTQ